MATRSGEGSRESLAATKATSGLRERAEANAVVEASFSPPAPPPPPPPPPLLPPPPRNASGPLAEERAERLVDSRVAGTD